MALEKEESLANGLDIQYWRLDGEIRIDYDNRTIHFVLYGYKSKRLRDQARATPGTTRDIRMSGDEFDRNFSRDPKLNPKANVNLTTQCYAAAKVVEADDHFRDAEDVWEK